MTESMISDSACEYLNNYGLYVGLLGQMQDNPETPLPSPEQVLLRLQRPECLVLALLQRARCHPLVSDEFTLLLLERLQSVKVFPNGTESDQRQCSLILHLAGTGSTATVMQRHLDDLRSLVGGLLQQRFVFSREWDPVHNRWNYGNGYRLKTVVLKAPGSQSAWLSWPDLSLGGSAASHWMEERPAGVLED